MCLVQTKNRICPKNGDTNISLSNSMVNQFSRWDFNKKNRRHDIHEYLSIKYNIDPVIDLVWGLQPEILHLSWGQYYILRNTYTPYLISQTYCWMLIIWTTKEKYLFPCKLNFCQFFFYWCLCGFWHKCLAHWQKYRLDIKEFYIVL